MKWIKASERLPEGDVCVRYLSHGKWIYASSEQWDNIEGMDIEWLDESEQNPEADSTSDKQKR